MTQSNVPQSDPPAPPGTLEVRVAADSPSAFSTGPAAQPRAVVAARAKRPLVIVAGIAAATFISVLAISLLFYKWSKSDDYTTLIIVWAPEQWVGATVTVTGANLPGALTQELTDRDKLLVRFHVPPGDYRVRVERDGKTLAQKRNDPAKPLLSNMIWWPFRAPPSATQPSAK